MVERSEISAVERPPMIEIPEYREKFLRLDTNALFPSSDTSSKI